MQAQDLVTILWEDFHITTFRHSAETSLAPGLGHLPFWDYLFVVTWWIFRLHNGLLQCYPPSTDGVTQLRSHGQEVAEGGLELRSLRFCITCILSHRDISDILYSVYALSSVRLIKDPIKLPVRVG